MKKRLLLMALATICLLLASCANGTLEGGRLEGKVTIGPSHMKRPD